MAETSPDVTVHKVIINGLNSTMKTCRGVLTSSNGGVAFIRLTFLMKISTNSTQNIKPTL